MVVEHIQCKNSFHHQHQVLDIHVCLSTKYYCINYVLGSFVMLFTTQG